MEGLKGFICSFLGCSENCNRELAKCYTEKDTLAGDLNDANIRVEYLESLLSHPPPPELEYVVEKDTEWVQTVLADFKANVIRLPLGPEFRLTNKEGFIKFVAWDWVDQFEYRKSFMCGNFAISFKAHADQYGINQVGVVLDYQAGHAYNLAVFPNRDIMLLEPQNDQIWYWEDKDLPFYVLEGAVVII